MSVLISVSHNQRLLSVLALSFFIWTNKSAFKKSVFLVGLKGDGGSVLEVLSIVGDFLFSVQ